jgi:hypothetical protein
MVSALKYKRTSLTPSIRVDFPPFIKKCLRLSFGKIFQNFYLIDFQLIILYLLQPVADYLKKLGTMCCIVPNIVASLFCQRETTQQQNKKLKIQDHENAKQPTTKQLRKS